MSDLKIFDDKTLVTQLNAAVEDHKLRTWSLVADAACVIERLIHERDQLRNALRPFADAIWVWSDDLALQADGIEREELAFARRLLEQTSDSNRPHPRNGTVPKTET